jgi:ABC-2 type transport system ATP-binding protein
MSKAFSIQGLWKSYSDFNLGPVDLDLEYGTILGFIGPNGAGKTTTIHCLAGLLVPDNADIEICGQPQSADDPCWKQKIGFVGEKRPFFEEWSGHRNLAILAPLYREWDQDLVNRLVERLDFDPMKPVQELSKGNRVKLALTATLAHRPRLLLFDEPTEGLDPVVRIEALNILREYMEEEADRAVFYATHVLSDITRLVDELVFIKNGKVFLRERVDQLVDRWRQMFFTYDGALDGIAGVSEYRSEGSDHRVMTSDHQATLEQLMELGVEDVHTAHLGIDEIAVLILKGEQGGPDHV